MIVTEEMYHNYRHSITEQTEDVIEGVANVELMAEPVTTGDVVTRGTRVSLTIRHVPSTSAFRIRLSR